MGEALKEFDHDWLGFLSRLHSRETPKISHTYSRHHRRSKTEISRNRRNDQEHATSCLVTEKGEVKISDDVQAPQDVFAPKTPDIDCTKHRNRVMLSKKWPVEDVPQESFLTNPDSYKRTCRRSLILNVRDFGLVYRKRIKSIQSISLPNKLKDSDCNEVSEERIESQNGEKKFLQARIQSFLSHIQHFQGERKFSAWKCSVTDSIVGAYLAQNTDDTFSSAAFMSLASKFPRKFLRNDNVVQNAKRKEKCISSRKRMRRQKGQKIKESKHDPELLNVLKEYQSKYYSEKKTLDTLDWESVRNAEVSEVSEAIKIRGMHNNLAERIKNCLDDLVKNFGSTNMEWIRDVPYDIAKKYLMNIYGMGLKSVECIRLLTLEQKAFPIDTNAGRVALRLGWFPLVQLKEGEEFHLLKEYPKLNSIQMYLWQYLSDYDFSTLYELHCHVITFAKVFCTERNPNCYECPLREECKYFASVRASKRDPTLKSRGLNLMDIEDHGIEKKKNPRTEHQVYILPNFHELLVKLKSKEPGETCPYLLAVWSPESLQVDHECTPEVDSVYGTILIPARTATRGKFPLNGTFFQANEVFADDESSKFPIKIPRSSLANLPSTTLYCATNMASVCKGMKSVEVQKCFKKGFVCFRGFNMRTREPKPLSVRFHASKSKKQEE